MKKPGQELKPMTPERVQRYVQRVMDDAVDFMTAELQPARDLADIYYQGGTDLVAPTGRSQVIVDCVRSGVSSVIPSIARIFTQTDTIAEFWTDDPKEEKGTKEATLFANHVYSKFNGYETLITMATDALKARIGAVKVSVEKKEVPRHAYVPAIPALSDQTASLESPPVDQSGSIPADGEDLLEGENEADQAQPQLTESDGEVDVFTMLTEKTIWRLDPIPPEEFVYSSDTLGPYCSQVMAHRRNMTIGDAMDLGYPYEDLINLASPGDQTVETEKYDRRDYVYDNTDNASDIDPLDRNILITEAYVKLDEDGDGIREIRRIVCGGINYTVLSDEPVNVIPFAICKATIQPHVFAPISLAEDLIQDQDAQTAMLRSIIDNAALVNSPRTVANERKVNLADLKNGEIGAIIRATEMGQVEELTTPATAAQTLPVLQALQETSEKRTGITKLNQGLDPDALQSTAKVAAAAAVSASDARIEMMARNIGETGVKSLFNLIVKLAADELDGPQTLKANGGYVQVTPSAWSDDMHVKINVGLGSGRIDEKKMVLQGLIQFQTAVIEKGGVATPMCTWENLRNSWATMLRLSGLHNTTDYLPYVPPMAVQAVDKQMKDSSKQQSDMQIQAQQSQLMIQKQQADAMRDMVQVENKKAELRFQEQMAKTQQKYEAEVQQLRGEIMTMQQQSIMDMRTTIIETNQKRDEALMKFFADMFKLGMTAEQNQIAAEQADTMANQQTKESIQ